MSSEAPMRNNVVLASAGSGKTFRLSDRIIKLLALGSGPEQIVALTFTRAAAAEFVAKTLDKLAEAAADEGKAQELRDRLGLGAACDAAFFRDLLRRTVLSMQRLTLGTLDSFFARLVVNNPTEVGLEGAEARTMGELEAKEARRSTLLAMLASTKAEEFAELARELRDLNQGKDVAMPLTTFEKGAEKLHDLLTLAPDPALWGDPEAIWGRMPALFTPPAAGEVARAAEALSSWLVGVQMHKTFHKTLTAHFPALAAAVSPGDLDAKHWKQMRGQLRPILMGQEGEPVSMIYGNSKNPVVFPADVCGWYRLLASGVLSKAMQGKLSQTQAIRRLLGRYEATYAEQVRRKGRLTFSDYVTLLLGAEGKLDIDYRLDCQVRHWLFDEFQDTSTRQWKVLENNLNEVLTNPDGSGSDWRTAFFVGDLKQSLYGWRAGNPRLLAEIRERMVRQEGPGAEDRLIETRRCSQPVVDAVNAVLGDLGAHGPFLSTIAAERWARRFETHRTLAKRAGDGEALWVRLPRAEGKDESRKAEEESEGEDGEEGGTIERQAAWIGWHLRESGALEGRRLREGITCAILVSKNEEASVITEVLRRMGVEAADEGETSVALDNPLTAGLVALIRGTAHPSDRRSEVLAMMSPAARETVAKLGGLAAARERIATRFAEEGAEAVVRLLTTDLAPAEPGNAADFARKRLRQLVALAVSYDAKGERSLDGFCAHLEGSSLRDTADPRSVQVLTVHRSKGLQYTMVYLPGLNRRNQKMASVRRDAPMIREGEDFTPRWILSRPQAALCDLDATLAPQVADEKSEGAYESLCRLYVGMTRAVRRLVMVTEALPKPELLRDEASHGKYDAAMLVEATLGLGKDEPAPSALGEAEVVWHRGSGDWLGLEVAGTSPAPVVEPVSEALVAVTRPGRLKPSAAGKHMPPRAWKPRTDSASGKVFGDLVHRLWEPLAWDAEAFLSRLDASAAAREPFADAAIHHIRDCMATPAIRDVLLRRPEGCVLWTERQASLMHEGKLMHAVFDRVHVIPGKEATILDYKTNDRLTDDELRETYKGQMELYRLAVSKLAGVPLENVRALLIHVRRRTVVEV